MEMKKNLKSIKTLKKITAVFLAVMMLLCTSMTTMFAFAAETQKGTITITDVKEGETYTFYKLLDVTYSKTGNDTNYSYRVNENFDDFFGGLGLEGYNSTDDTITSAECKAAYDYVYARSTPEEISMFATEVAKYAKANNIASNPSAVTASSSDDITINDVDAGYYIMVPSSSVNGEKTLTSALFSINTLTDSVSIMNKSVYPDLNKFIVDEGREVKINDAGYGENVSYELKTNVPHSMNGYEKYTFTITDTLDGDFSFNNDVAVTLNGTALAKDTDFTVVENNGVITINFVDFEKWNTDEFRDKDIIVTYSAKVGTTADLGSIGNTNTAYLTFSNDPRDTASTERTKDTTVTTYIAGLMFTKTNADGSVKLADTEFEITGWNNDTTPLASNIANEGVYNTSKITLRTTQDGVISVLGLKEGTYTITETDAPNGYIKLDNPIKITITFNETTGEFEAQLVGTDEHISDLALLNTGDNSGIATFKILNETMKVLPDTGSTTAILCGIFGILAIAAAGVVISKSKREKETSANGVEKK